MGWKFYFIFTASAIIIIISLGHLIKKGKLRLCFNTLDIIVLAFYLYTFIRLLFTKYARVDSIEFEIFTFLIILYFICKEFISINLGKGKLNVPVFILLSVFLIAGLIESLIGIFQLYNILPGYVDSYFKVNGTFTSPDHYAGYLSAVIPFSLGTFKFTKKKSTSEIFLKYLGLFTCLASLFILPVLRERSSFVAVALGIIFIYLYSPKVKEVFKKITKSVLKKVVLIISIILFLFISARILYNMRPVSVEGRMLIWKITGNMIKEHPL